MALKEVDYQKKLIDGAKEAGGYGWKLSNMNVSGIVDLFIQVPFARGAFIEVKMFELPVRMDAPMKAAHWITPLQRKSVLDIRRATGGSNRGVVTGWVGILPEGQGRVKMYASADPDHKPTREEFEHQCVIRNTGQGWGSPVVNLIKAIDPDFA